MGTLDVWCTIFLFDLPAESNQMICFCVQKRKNNFHILELKSINVPSGRAPRSI